MMHTISVLGAGRSAGYFIDYITQLCEENNWKLTIADIQTKHLKITLSNLEHLRLLSGDLGDSEFRREAIKGSNWVVSLLPAFMHVDVAKDCLIENCNLATASYVSEEMHALGLEAKEKGLVFLNECGLDPGIDHMSAMQIIEKLKAEGCQITGFESYCGGLIASDCIGDNPWKYKFSWNPRNVILAGNSAATGLKNGKLKVVPYNRNFQYPVQIELPDQSKFDGYINRDSLSYQSIYKLENVQTMIRGTLRYPGYCRAWNILVHLGLTDATYQYPLYKGITYREFFHSFLNGNDHEDIHQSIRNTLGMPDYEMEAIDKVLWTGLNSNDLIPIEEGSPATVLQGLLEQKWKLLPNDRDLVVMQHRIEYVVNGNKHLHLSSLSVEGINNIQTAMSKTVGLPLAIALKQFLKNNLPYRGIVLPVYRDIYEPVLNELETFGIKFTNQTRMVSESIPESEPK